MRPGSHQEARLLPQERRGLGVGARLPRRDKGRGLAGGAVGSWGAGGAWGPGRGHSTGSSSACPQPGPGPCEMHYINVNLPPSGAPSFNEPSAWSCQSNFSHFVSLFSVWGNPFPWAVAGWQLEKFSFVEKQTGPPYRPTAGGRAPGTARRTQARPGTGWAPGRGGAGERMAPAQLPTVLAQGLWAGGGVGEGGGRALSAAVPDLGPPHRALGLRVSLWPPTWGAQPGVLGAGHDLPAAAPPPPCREQGSGNPQPGLESRGSSRARSTPAPLRSGPFPGGQQGGLHIYSCCEHVCPSLHVDTSLFWERGSDWNGGRSGFTRKSQAVPELAVLPRTHQPCELPRKPCCPLGLGPLGRRCGQRGRCGCVSPRH